MDKEYSPADICKWFNIPRTTLFRWEEEGRIPLVKRGKKRRRIYEDKHLRAISSIILNNISADIKNSAEQDSPTFSIETQEKLYRARFFSGFDVEHNIQQLAGLARIHDLSADTINILAIYGLNLPVGDPIRRMIWELFLVNDSK